MSHTTKIGKTVFIHDGDYTGMVTIVRPDGQRFDVPADDLAGFIAERIRSLAINDLENASHDRLLSLVLNLGLSRKEIAA